METNIQNLIAKYNEGLADPAEVAQLEKRIESGEVSLVQLQNLSALDEKVVGLTEQVPSMKLDDGFYAMLAKEKKSLKRESTFSWSEIFKWNPKLSLGFTMLVLGLIGGYFFSYVRPNSDVKELSNQVSQMKEMMMLTLLEKESATERLKAVSLTSDMSKASKKVTDALIQVLNTDPNVNVRLATLDALEEYAKQPEVRVQLVKSIALQDSPLVQIELAELMVALNEKSSVNELKKLMEEKNTPKEVKEKLKESISVLI